MEEEPTLKEKVDALYYGQEKVRKPKKFKIPMKARLNKGKMKKGYVTIVKFEDNMNIDFVREPIIDGTYKLDGDSFHAVDSEDVFFYKNKPVIFQAKRKLNPSNLLKSEHQTYGQKYIMARMKSDSIIGKKKMGWGAGIIGLVVLGIIIYAVMSGGG